MNPIEATFGQSFLRLDQSIYLNRLSDGFASRLPGVKTKPTCQITKKHVNIIDATFMAQSSKDFVRAFILKKSRTSLNTGNGVGW